jgi:predicted RNA binding protein YcfA (HicA-like mRNA interferase family)
MSIWKSSKAKVVLKALEKNGWQIIRIRGSHKILSKENYPNFIFAFHDKEEIGPKMLSRISKHTGLKPEDL